VTQIDLSSKSIPARETSRARASERAGERVERERVVTESKRERERERQRVRERERERRERREKECVIGSGTPFRGSSVPQARN